MYEILAITLTIHLWHILLAITIVSFIICAILDGNAPGGQFFPAIPIYVPVCIVLNLLMWLIYFMIAYFCTKGH